MHLTPWFFFAQLILLTIRNIFVKKVLDLVQSFKFWGSLKCPIFDRKRRHFVSRPSFGENGKSGLCDVMPGPLVTHGLWLVPLGSKPEKDHPLHKEENNNNRYLSRVSPSVARTVINGGPDVQIELEFGSVGFVEGGKPENPENNPRSKATTNNQTQPTASRGIEPGSQRREVSA